MKYFKIFIVFILLLTGCSPKNQYIGNLQVGYHLYDQDQKVDQKLFEFYYGYSVNEYINKVVSYFSSNDLEDVLPFDISKDINSLSDTMCTINTYKDITWEEYFSHQAMSHYAKIESLYEHALNNHFEIKDEYKETSNQLYQSLQEYCSTNKIKEEDYLHSMFGLNASSSFIKEQYLKIEIVNQYISYLQSKISEEDIKEYYQEHPEEINTLTIRYFAFEKSEEGKINALKMASSIKSQDDFKKQAVIYASEDYKAYYQTNDLTLRENLTKSSIPEYLHQALFKEMKINDVKMVEGEESYDVVMLIDQIKPDYHTVNLATIYLDARSSDSDDLTQEKLDVCYDFAKNLLKEMKSKGLSVDLFKSYNKTYADDKTNEGIYYQVNKQECSSSIASWAFDQKRKTGDSEILKSTYGYSIVYFIEKGSKEYLVSAEEKLREDIYQDIIDQYLDTHQLIIKKV